MSWTNKRDCHQLFVFVRRKPDDDKCFRRIVQSYESISPILDWSAEILESSGIWRLKSYAETRGLGASSGLARGSGSGRDLSRGH
jgi:hypothetical protein